ncbi:MAG: hypothetical protein WBB01_06195 [Phormidesmis sp.]
MRQQTVHLFVLNGLTDWEVGFVIAGVNNPAFQKHPGRSEVDTSELNGPSKLFSLWGSLHTRLVPIH